MEENTVNMEEKALRETDSTVNGEIVSIGDEKYYKISNYDMMPPFLMSIVSNSDLWMFISSNGALSAGRKNPDQALFPYYTDDRIHDSQNVTGSTTILFVVKDGKQFLWEPFSSSYYKIYNTRRNIYKSIIGNKVIFEEINNDLSISYQYSWQNCDRYGFIRKSQLINNNSEPVEVNILDGIQNILPYGVDRKFQLEYSTLLDAYKKNELIEDLGLGIYTLSSIPTDKAEPNESLRATIVWSVGLNNAKVLLSSKQIKSFASGKTIVQNKNVNAYRGAYLLQSEFSLKSGAVKDWYITADVNKDQSDVAKIASLLSSNRNLRQLIEEEVFYNTVDLDQKIAKADGFQLTNDSLVTFRHVSNVLFNIMRGGIFDDSYSISKKDFLSFIVDVNPVASERYSSFVEELPDKFSLSDLNKKAVELKDVDFEKMCCEYLPLTFSRRHGDPSRPWNLFSIDIKDDSGNKVLNYQGNWRDVFQNWEALSYSFPEYVESMITKFLNSSTADGYNPYKLTREGFDWEKLDPVDTWSYIGYWGDHQIIYLLKLLELSVQFHPGVLQSLFTKEIFAYAEVPYRIKPYDAIVEDPHNTIEFDHELDEAISKRVKETGEDGKYIQTHDNKVYHINLVEKLLVPVLVKLSNFIPEAGIWMNTQRPEWNDANNALVGYGVSMVTLYYLRRFLDFSIKLFKSVDSAQINVSVEVYDLFTQIKEAFTYFESKLDTTISDIDRKDITDKLGKAGSTHRLRIYANGFSGEKSGLNVSEIVRFFELALSCVDHSVKANKRDDDLYHSYNLIKFNSGEEIKIRRLYEMLEGQVAVLSSGYLSTEASISLLASLRKSSLYRKDQNSYILYPQRVLSPFMKKNIIPEELLERSKVLKEMIANDDRRIVAKDVNGKVRFNSMLRNASYLQGSLEKTQLSIEDKRIISDIYEGVFDHQSFTGRSGTFYKYEGLGSIYWHMVSKLLLAVQEIFYKAKVSNKGQSILAELADRYYDIREGIGVHKSPGLYGAFPTDPYSHTPAGMGAQQPGMTGQVKEDIITRFGELGLVIKDGEIQFIPVLLKGNEFLEKSQVYEYYDVSGIHQSLMLNPGMLAYTFCQIPVVYISAEEPKILLTLKDDTEEEIEGLTIHKAYSKLIFQRKDTIARITVLINKINSLNKG